MNRVLPFHPPNEPRHGAGRLALTRLRHRLGRLLLRLGVPGAIRDCELHDTATGCRVQIRVSALAVRVSVGERDFYFDRFTGHLEGAGNGVA